MKIKLFALFLLLPILANSQNWLVYNSSNSLIPDNHINCITIDQMNNKWIGTAFGLAVFSDTTWQIYNTTNSALPDNDVRCIYIDSAGNKWIGTHNSGLTLFDGTNWYTWHTGNSTLPDNHVKSINIDANGLLWVGTTGGLSYFNGSKFETFDINNSILFSNNITHIRMMPANVKMICSVNGGLTFATDTVEQVYTILNSGFPDNSNYNSDSDATGISWLASAASGLIAYLGGTTWTTYNTATSPIASNSLTALCCQNNLVWICTLNNGLILKNGLSFINYTMSNSPLPENGLTCITTDTSGQVWIGSQNSGIIKLTPSLAGVTEMNTGNPVRAFVNHVASMLVVHSSETPLAALEIFDCNGRLLSEALANNSTHDEINIATLQAGLFILKVRLTNGTTEVLRFVKPY